MTCRLFEARLSELEDYVSGESADAQAIETHLAVCSQCSEAVKDARLAGALLRETLEPTAEASAAFWTRLGAHLREEEARQGAAGDFWGAMEQFARRVALSAAVAAVVMAAVLVGMSLTSENVTANQQPEIRELVQRPAPPANHEEVLMSLTNNNGGRQP